MNFGNKQNPWQKCYAYQLILQYIGTKATMPGCSQVSSRQEQLQWRRFNSIRKIPRKILKSCLWCVFPELKNSKHFLGIQAIAFRLMWKILQVAFDTMMIKSVSMATKRKDKLVFGNLGELPRGGGSSPECDFPCVVGATWLPNCTPMHVIVLQEIARRVGVELTFETGIWCTRMPSTKAVSS